MDTVINLIYLASLLASAIFALIYRKYLSGRKLTILIPYLFAVVIQETVLTLGSWFHLFKSTAIVYNIYQPVSAVVFAYIYFSIPFMSSLKKLIAVMTIAYLLLVLVNYSFFESISITSTYPPIARGFLITFCAVLFSLGCPFLSFPTHVLGIRTLFSLPLGFIATLLRIWNFSPP